MATPTGKRRSRWKVLFDIARNIPNLLTAEYRTTTTVPSAALRRKMDSIVLDKPPF